MGKIILSNESRFNDEVIESKVPVIVHFYSDDCLPCINLDDVLNRIIEKYDGYVKIVKIHKQKNRNLTEKLKIKTSPTLILYKDGKEFCSRFNGYISAKEIDLAVKGLIDGYCEVKEKEIVNADILVLGGGPAGLTAAIYASRARLATVVIDEGITGGQVASTYQIYNYPGTNGVIRGMDLMENMKRQALSSDTRIDDLKEIIDIKLEGKEKVVKTSDTLYKGKAIIIATGAVPRKLPAEGEAEYRGRGVHYCATCDGPMYQDAEIIVVGGGNSAVEEAVFLTRYAKNVILIHQLDHFQANQSAQNELLKNPDIKVLWNTEVRSINGKNFVTGVTVQDLITKEIRNIETEGIFVYIGMIPKSDMFRGKISVNEYGYIPTNENMETNIPGIYAVGDVREKIVRQISTAVGDGTIAGVMAEKYINNK